MVLQTSLFLAPPPPNTSGQWAIPVLNSPYVATVAEPAEMRASAGQGARNWQEESLRCSLLMTFWRQFWFCSYFFEICSHAAWSLQFTKCSTDWPPSCRNPNSAFERCDYKCVSTIGSPWLAEQISFSLEKHAACFHCHWQNQHKGLGFVSGKYAELKVIGSTV